MSADATIDALEAIGTARSMRWFLPEPVPSELIEQVLWAATRASNPSNTQPWDFVVVRDPDVRARIGTMYAEMMRAASAHAPAEPDPSLSLTDRLLHEGAVHLLNTMADVPVLIYVCGVLGPNDDRADPVGMYSAVFAAAQNLLVAARALGLGAAFTTLHRFFESGLRELLGIPEDRVMAVTVPLGWPARRFGPLHRRPLSEVVHYDHW
jgi:nitroreductase